MLKKCPFCAEEIQQEAIVCKHCGRDLNAPAVSAAPKAVPKKTSPVAMGCLLLIGAFILFGLLSDTRVPSQPGRAVLPRPIGGAAPVVTKAEFDRIREGMTYEQVVKIIGTPGDLQSSSDLGGYKTVMYAWMNSGGSNMNAMFQNGKLIQKAQFGLP